MHKDLFVTKASGQIESFDEEKLRRSLRHSGADELTINQILQNLAGQWSDGMSTKSIFRQAFKMLKRLHQPTAARYSLKQGIFDFGPSGFPFEDFFAEVLKHQGYQVRTRQVLSGRCVQHEVDVVAEKEGVLIWVECKYHPMAGSVSNVKIPLYIHSRFRDLEQYRNSHSPLPGQKLEGWIATNTRFSDDAINYARCAGLHLIGWNYPAEGSLRQLIDQGRLYPITCLTTLTHREKMQLLEHGLVLSKMLCKPGNWPALLHLSGERRDKVTAEAKALCGETD